jgi:hypothetical protein
VQYTLATEFVADQLSKKAMHILSLVQNLGTPIFSAPLLHCGSATWSLNPASLAGFPVGSLMAQRQNEQSNLHLNCRYLLNQPLQSATSLDREIDKYRQPIANRPLLQL